MVKVKKSRSVGSRAVTVRPGSASSSPRPRPTRKRTKKRKKKIPPGEPVDDTNPDVGPAPPTPLESHTRIKKQSIQGLVAGPPPPPIVDKNKREALNKNDRETHAQLVEIETKLKELDDIEQVERRALISYSDRRKLFKPRVYEYWTEEDDMKVTISALEKLDREEHEARLKRINEDPDNWMEWDENEDDFVLILYKPIPRTERAKELREREEAYRKWREGKRERDRAKKELYNRYNPNKYGWFYTAGYYNKMYPKFGIKKEWVKQLRPGEKAFIQKLEGKEESFQSMYNRWFWPPPWIAEGKPHMYFRTRGIYMDFEEIKKDYPEPPNTIVEEDNPKGILTVGEAIAQRGGDPRKLTKKRVYYIDDDFERGHCWFDFYYDDVMGLFYLKKAGRDVDYFFDNTCGVWRKKRPAWQAHDRQTPYDYYYDIKTKEFYSREWYRGPSEWFYDEKHNVWKLKDQIYGFSPIQSEYYRIPFKYRYKAGQKAKKKRFVVREKEIVSGSSAGGSGKKKRRKKKRKKARRVTTAEQDKIDEEARAAQNQNLSTKETKHQQMKREQEEKEEVQKKYQEDRDKEIENRDITGFFFDETKGKWSLKSKEGGDEESKENKDKEKEKKDTKDTKDKDTKDTKDAKDSKDKKDKKDSKDKDKGKDKDKDKNKDQDGGEDIVFDENGKRWTRKAENREIEWRGMTGLCPDDFYYDPYEGKFYTKPLRQGSKFRYNIYNGAWQKRETIDNNRLGRNMMHAHRYYWDDVEGAYKPKVHQEFHAQEFKILNTTEHPYVLHKYTNIWYHGPAPRSGLQPGDFYWDSNQKTWLPRAYRKDLLANPGETLPFLGEGKVYHHQAMLEKAESEKEKYYWDIEEGNFLKKSPHEEYYKDEQDGYTKSVALRDQVQKSSKKKVFASNFYYDGKKGNFFKKDENAPEGTYEFKDGAWRKTGAPQGKSKPPPDQFVFDENQERWIRAKTNDERQKNRVRIKKNQNEEQGSPDNFYWDDTTGTMEVKKGDELNFVFDKTFGVWRRKGLHGQNKSGRTPRDYYWDDFDNRFKLRAKGSEDYYFFDTSLNLYRRKFAVDRTKTGLKPQDYVWVPMMAKYVPKTQAPKDMDAYPPSFQPPFRNYEKEWKKPPAARKPQSPPAKQGTSPRAKSPRGPKRPKI